MQPWLSEAIRLHQGGKLADAAVLYRRILQANPRHFEAPYLLGHVHSQTGEHAEAVRLIGAALEINSRSPDGWYNHGCSLMALGRNAEALSSFERALELNPTYYDAAVNRAAMLMALQRYTQAAAAYGAILKIKPDEAGALAQGGEALAQTGRDAEALALYDRYLALMPRDAGVLFRRGNLLLKMKRLEDAVAAFEAALVVDPDSHTARGNLLHCRLHACDWRKLDQARARFSEDAKAGRLILGQIENMALSDSPDDLLRCFTTWSRVGYPPAPNPLWRGERYRHGKIRIAYLSADFHNHATAYLMAGLFEEHDRKRFEITGVSFGPSRADEMRSRLMPAFDTFLDVRAESDEAVAHVLRARETDIAVDLKGYTYDCRPGILGHRDRKSVV